MSVPKIPFLAVHCPHGDRVLLYRFYDSSGVLLYVGITNTPHERWAAHARDSEEWWPSVAVVHSEWHDTRDLAEKAEATAIKDEKPLHNRVHNGRPYRYSGRRFPASQLHPIAREHFGDRAFSYRDLIEELGVPSGTVVSYGNRLVDQGAFRPVGRQRSADGRERNHFVAVQLDT